MTLSNRLSTLILCLAAGSLVACGDKGEDDSGDPSGGAAGTDGTDGTDGSDGTDGTDGSDGGDSDSLGPGAQFLYDYGMRGCELYRQCSPPEALEAYPYESCVQQIETAAAAYPEDICTFHEDNAATCMAWINSVDCDGYNSDAPEACSNAYTCPS